MRVEPVRQRLASSYFVVAVVGASLLSYLFLASKLLSAIQGVTQFSSLQYNERLQSISNL
jgi:hypothetical protein